MCCEALLSIGYACIIVIQALLVTRSRSLTFLVRQRDRLRPERKRIAHAVPGFNRPWGL